MVEVFNSKWFLLVRLYSGSSVKLMVHRQEALIDLFMDTLTDPTIKR